MNNTFDCKRFGKLFSRDFRNIWPSFGLTMLIISLMPLAFWLSCMVGFGDLTILPGTRRKMLGITVLLTLMLAPSRLYKTCNLPQRGIYFAMLPASKLEKYLSMLLHCGAVCPLMVLAGGFVLDYLLSLFPFGPYTQQLFDPTVYMQGEISMKKLWINIFASSNLVGSSMSFIALFFLSYMAYFTFFIFTNTVFRKHKVVRTILWSILIWFVLLLACIPWMKNEFVLSEVFVQWLGISVFVGESVFVIACLWWSACRLKQMKY